MKYKDENRNNPDEALRKKNVLKFFTFEIVYFSRITDQIQIKLKVLTDKIQLFSFEMCPHFQTRSEPNCRPIEKEDSESSSLIGLTLI